MISRTISKTPLASDPGQAQAQLEQLASTLAPKDAAAGQQLRAVAVDLVRRGLHVAVVGYHDGWTELEATLPQAPHLGPAADAAAALLRGLAACPPLTPPPALTPARDPPRPAPPGQVSHRRCHDPRGRLARAYNALVAERYRLSKFLQNKCNRTPNTRGG